MFVCLDTETIVMLSKDTEVVIGPDKDKAEGQLSSETEELLLADHFGAFKGKKHLILPYIAQSRQNE